MLTEFQEEGARVLRDEKSVPQVVALEEKLVHEDAQSH
jgi:hypothetical protein